MAMRHVLLAATILAGLSHTAQAQVIYPGAGVSGGNQAVVMGAQVPQNRQVNGMYNNGYGVPNTNMPMANGQMMPVRNAMSAPPVYIENGQIVGNQPSANNPVLNNGRVQGYGNMNSNRNFNRGQQNDIYSRNTYRNDYGNNNGQYRTVVGPNGQLLPVDSLGRPVGLTTTTTTTNNSTATPQGGVPTTTNSTNTVVTTTQPNNGLQNGNTQLYDRSGLDQRQRRVRAIYNQ